MKFIRLLFVAVFSFLASGLYSQVNVVWGKSSGVTISGNSLTKTVAAGWNAGAYSANILAAGQDGGTQFTVVNTASVLAFGLTKTPTTFSYKTMEFSIVLQTPKKINIYRFGKLLGSFGISYNTGDVFGLERLGSVMYFYRISSGNTTVIYQYTAISGEPMVVGGFINTSGATLSNAVASFGQPLTITNASITNQHCSGTNLGSVSISVAGGVPPYTYLWNNGNTTASIFNVLSGMYNVAVTDASSTQVLGSYTVANCVEWADALNISVNGAIITSTASTVGWDNSGATSYNILPTGQDGWVQMPVGTPNAKGVETAFGLTAEYAGPDYGTFDFSFLMNGPTVYAYLRGVKKAIAKVITGDILEIQRTGTQVSFIIINPTTGSSSTIYTSTVTSNDLVVGTALYTPGSSVSNITCSFSNNLKVDANIQYNQQSSSPGSVNLTIGENTSPFQVAWNGIIYPTRGRFVSYIDSVAAGDSLVVDTNVYHVPDSLRLIQAQQNLASVTDPVSVMDANTTVSINADIAPPQNWYNTTGVTITSISIPRFVSRIANDSTIDTLQGQNLSQPVVTFAPANNGSTITKASGTWAKATSTDIVLASQNLETDFVVNSPNSILAAGVKNDATSDDASYHDILYGFYFNTKGSLSLIINGSTASIGSYRSGDRFSIWHTYDPIKNVERFFYKQNGQLLKVAYNSYGSGTNNSNILASSIIYSFKVAINSAKTSLYNINLIGYSPIIIPIVKVTPATCGLPTSAQISTFFGLTNQGGIHISAYWVNIVTNHQFPVGNVVINSAPLGVYFLHISYTSQNQSYAPIISGPYFVGYNASWSTLNDATIQPDNSIKQISPFAPNAGGNTSNTIYGSSQSQFVAFQTSGGLFNFSGCGFSLNASATTFSPSHLSFGIVVEHYPYFFNPFTVCPIAIRNSTIIGVLPPVGNSTLTYIIQYNSNNQIIYSDYAGTSLHGYQSYGYTTQSNIANSPMTVQAVLASAFISASVSNVISSAPCLNFLTEYATLTKQLDGSFYTVPTNGNLSFRYDEEYVNNSNALTYTIYNNSITPITATLTPDNYKDNYYSLNLAQLYPSLPHDYYILVVTNKKGEQTELRFKY